MADKILQKQLISEGSSKLASVPSGGAAGAATGGAAAAGGAADAPKEEEKVEGKFTDFFVQYDITHTSRY